MIERLENDIQTLHAAMAQADYYRRASDVIAEEAARVKQMEAQLAETYQRWETLEQQAN